MHIPRKLTEREKVIDILDKMQFFQGQRAGREIWNDKTKEVQEQDLENFNRDIHTIRDYICYLEKEQEKSIKLPCKIGDDVYFIPSSINYRLNVLNKHEENNRVYHQKVERISFVERGWYVELDKDMEYGTGRICSDIFFGKTWFLSEEEAEEKLKQMKGE